MNSSNRSFGYTFAIFFILIFLYRLIYLGIFSYLILSVSLIFSVLAFLKSKYLTIPNRIWIKFGLLLGRIISPIIMYLIYFLAIFPVKGLLNIFKKDIIDIKIDKNINTYWRKYEKKEIDNMNNQF